MPSAKQTGAQAMKTTVTTIAIAITAILARLEIPHPTLHLELLRPVVRLPLELNKIDARLIARKTGLFSAMV